MSRTPKHDSNLETPPPRPMKKSTFVTQMEMQRQERISTIQPNKRQLSFSSFLDLYPENSKGNFYKSHIRRQNTDKLQQTQDEIKRARSAKALIPKPGVEGLQKNIGSQLNQNVIRLKMQETSFKYKLKISNLLKQLNIPVHQMNRFSNIQRVDDILNFLSQKVRQKIVNTQINEANINKVRSKQKGTLNQYEIQIQSLTKKLKDKEISEKVLKSKVKQLHSESQQLLDKLNIKQKELSSKITELYQLKTNQKQSEKTYQNLKYRYDLLQKQTNGYREQLQSNSKDIIADNKDFIEESLLLKQKVQQIQEELTAYKQKQNTLTDINNQLTQQLTRWRERFQDIQFTQTQTKKSTDSVSPLTEVVPQRSRGLKKSTMSMSINMVKGEDNFSRPRLSGTALQLQNMKLTIKIEELQKKNKQLSRDILNYATIKERYDQNLGVKGETANLWSGFDSQKSIGLKQSSKEIYQHELQIHYKKKIQDVANEWKQKLYEIVHKYEDDLQLTQQKVDSLSAQKQQLQKKVKELAVEKYALENKVISHEKQIYQLLKMYKNTNRNFQEAIKESQSHHSDESRKSSFAQIKQQKVQSQTQQPELSEIPRTISNNI